ncbi:hypothetical protein ACET3Z_021498 [Daucus carota]
MIAKDVGEENPNEKAGQDTIEENGDESDVSWHEDSSNLDETDDDIHFEAYVDQDEVGQDDNRKQTSQYDDASTDYGTSSDERMALKMQKSDGKVKEKEVAEASGKNNETGGITGTNEASENNEQVEISQGVSQHVDNLQESQEPIVQPTP